MSDDSNLLVGLIVVLLLAAVGTWWYYRKQLSTLTQQLTKASTDLALSVRDARSAYGSSKADAISTDVKDLTNNVLELRQLTCLALDEEVGGDYTQAKCKSGQSVPAVLTLLNSSMDNIIDGLIAYNRLQNANPAVADAVAVYYKGLKALMSDTTTDKMYAQVRQRVLSMINNLNYGTFRSTCSQYKQRGAAFIKEVVIGGLTTDELLNTMSGTAQISPSVFSMLNIDKSSDVGTGIITLVSVFIEDMYNVMLGICANANSIEDIKRMADDALRRAYTEIKRMRSSLLLVAYPTINRLANDRANKTYTVVQ
jgi:hypothetical protein